MDMRWQYLDEKTVCKSNARPFILQTKHTLSARINQFLPCGQFLPLTCPIINIIRRNYDLNRYGC